MTQAHGPLRPAMIAGACLFGWFCLGSGVGTARADRITLRGGGQVKGKVVPDKARAGQFLLYGETGKTPMVLKKDQIVQVTPEKSALDEYVTLIAKDRKTAKEEFDLGTWCEEHKLPDLALAHFEQAVKRDSTFEAAHQKLGHVLMGGRWLNGEEVKEAQGMVKYKGRWMTPEEKERREMSAATVAEGSAWVKKIKLYRESVLSGTPDRAQEAERRLLAIQESVAVGPVMRVLADDEIPGLRALAVRVLGGIDGQEASSGLVGLLLAEQDEAVRQTTLEAVARRKPAEVVPTLLRALKSTQHPIVNRAAMGLLAMNAVTTVPRLVPALITVEYQVVTDPGSGNPNAGAPGPGFSNYSSTSIPVLTPPAVTDGAIAFGITSVPYGSGTSIGGNGNNNYRAPSQRLVPVEHQNAEVRAALVRMTGRDFGYDIQSWKQWIATSFKVEAPPTRRVPQP